MAMEEIKTPPPVNRKNNQQERTLVTLIGKGDAPPEISVCQHDRDMQVAEHESVVAILWGQPTNAHGQKVISAHQLIETYLHADRFVAGRFCGRFAFLLWDARRRRLIVATDRLARYKLYYHLVTDKTGRWRLRIATSPDTLAEIAEASIESRAVHLFLAMGVVPVPFTLWQGIESIPPASMILFEGKQWVRKNYWQPRFSYLEHGEAAPLIEQFQTKLHDWVEQYKKQQGLLWLQGSPLDQILLDRLAAEGVFEPMTISISADYRPPRRLQQLTERYGVPHQHVPLTAETLLMQLDEIASGFHQPVSDITAVHAYLAQAVGRQSQRQVATTVGIDAVLAGGPVLNRKTPLVAQMLKRFGAPDVSEDGLGRYLQLAVRSGLEDAAMDWLQSEGERWLRHIKATSSLDQMTFLDWVWRWSSGTFQSPAIAAAFAERDGALQQSLLSDEWLQWSCQVPATLKREGGKPYALLHVMSDDRNPLTTLELQQWPKFHWKMKKTGLIPATVSSRLTHFFDLNIDAERWQQWLDKLPRVPNRAHSLVLWRLLMLSTWLKHHSVKR
ncbi:MAG: hypothetical protein D6694_04630 [Gammaproteobacteria bacterium]|nr:MAG: hypothetical protein D6694_04630 [Gammaproteobacteria bacterium]